MGRYENKLVFEDTEKLCKQNTRLKDSVRKATEGQRLILETEQLPSVERNRFDAPAKVVVSGRRTLEAAAVYRGTKTAVHNFASASNPGGGVANGANAQEECICRCSGLYFSLNTPKMWDGFYSPHREAHDPIHNDDIIYTSGVTVFKTDQAAPELMEEADWYDVDVITCAAPNLRSQPSNGYNSGDGNRAVKVTDRELLAIHEKRLRRILDVAVMEKCETIILGAFGCGAFMNKPDVVAMAAKNVVKDYLHAFRNIEFAVYCSPRDEQNYKVFQRILKPLTQ